MKTHFFTLATISLLFLLTACGGGSSSGGPTVITINDGVYEGQQTIIISDPDGEVVGDGTFLFTMTVFENSLTIFDAGFSADADIMDGSFSAVTNELVESDGEVTCRIIYTYTGVVNDGLVLGTIGGTYICSLIGDPIFEVIFPVRGSFEAVRGVVASKISPIGNTEHSFENIEEAIKGMSE